jgi:SAM-dependent methyltransferase
MQGYSEGFAYIYNMRWTFFAANMAPRIQAFYEATSLGKTQKRLLDIACGTGQLAIHFLDRGYEVVGLDLSPAMLAHARANAAAYVDAGKARFVEGDAASFTFDEQFGLVVSTFDALNHLPDAAALAGCFVSTFDVLMPAGWFIFDLNTRFGLQRWAGINVQEEEDLVLITRGVFLDNEHRAYTQISGFLREEDGRYRRFNETAYNSIFVMDHVRTALAATGFRHVHFAEGRALDTPVEAPEDYGRIFVVAQK